MIFSSVFSRDLREPHSATYTVVYLICGNSVKQGATCQEEQAVAGMRNQDQTRHARELRQAYLEPRYACTSTITSRRKAPGPGGKMPVPSLGRGNKTYHPIIKSLT
ncbi:Verlamelin biosynthesis protein B [Fusarium oxysporum f. sp. albedinis]|nr:Verlamelin biosynthesis protein B [Fusarium oxysporum f. sp. albedinis]